MRHFIIVKFKDKSDAARHAEAIQTLFNEAYKIDGVRSANVHVGNSTRANRFDLMIEMDLTPEALEVYDISEMHKTWKAEYGDKIAQKTIFDCE
jgi:hypothetical protein